MKSLRTQICGFHPSRRGRLSSVMPCMCSGGGMCPYSFVAFGAI